MVGTDERAGGDGRRTSGRSAAFGRNAIVGGGAVLVLVIVFAAFQLSPWPGALLIRAFFDYDSAQTARALEPHVPPNIVTRANLSYDDADPDALLDLYLPAGEAGVSRALPVIVWVHGGGWVSGSRENVGNYAKILAGAGHAVAAVGYSIAPRHTYPRPVQQVNAALAFLAANAAALEIDASRFVLAGDSAGAQIAAQVATTISDPGYADTIGIEPGLEPGQLCAMLLYSGAYDLASANYAGIAGWFVRTVLWAYSGSADFAGNPELAKASVIDFVTAEFPPSFISAGNGDPLLEQSVAFAARLKELGVEAETLFFPESLSPALPHIYQFNLDTEGGQEALRRSVDFLRSTLGAH